MAIRVPEGEKLIDIPNLTMIRVVKSLHEFLVDGDGDENLVANAKKLMRQKRVQFAQSDAAIASLRAGTALGPVDPFTLWELVGTKGGLTREQFLKCVSIRVEPLEEFLPGRVIAGMRKKVGGAEPRLVTEFKPGVETDFIEMTIGLGKLIEKHVKPKAA
jgi:hypothetical protein